MPARKAGKKSAKKSAGTSKKAPTASLQKVNSAILIAKIRRREWVMYGIPIFNVAALGNIAQMRSVAQAARTHVEDVQGSIRKLDAAIRAKSSQ